MYSALLFIASLLSFLLGISFKVFFLSFQFAIPFAYMLNNRFILKPEGTHLMIPWFERPIIYDVRARPHLVESTSGSRDLQMVNT